MWHHEILRRRVSEGEQRVVDGISTINHYKYLGVTVDNHLSFETQIDQLSKMLLATYSHFHKLISKEIRRWV